MWKKDKEIVLKVEGMDCADCALQIEKSLSRLKGIRSARVSLATSKLVVEPSDADLDVEAVAREVRKLGYRLEGEGKTQSITLFVAGMDCAEEAEVIRKKLRGLPGVKSHQINFMRERLAVLYDPSALTPQEILKAISETGMKAKTESARGETKPWWQETRVRLIFVSGLLTLGGFVLERLGGAPLFAQVLFGAAILAGGYFPIRMAVAGLRTRTLNIYTLLVIAALGALAMNLWEETALLVVIYSWGAVMESYALEKARGSLKHLMELVPRTALVRKGDKELTLPVEETVVGDIVIVKPGEKIPMDGIVQEGFSTVDQSPITGESLPVSKGKGDEVFAGTINQRGSLEIEITKLSRDTTLAKIIHSVEESEAKKSSYQHFAEKFGKYYTPAMFFSAFLLATIPALLGEPFTPWFYRALVLLVVSCSCGLALSVPIAVLAAISNAARKGLLIKGGADLEATAKLQAVVFDKTGTLTIGHPAVTDILPFTSSPKELLSLAAAIEARSEHPLAGAILRKAKEEEVAIPHTEDFQSLTGLGARATVKGEAYYIGSRRLFEELPQEAERELARLEGEGKTTLLIAKGREVLGIIAVADQLRAEARETVRELKRRGVKRVIMLTGDNEGTARAIAAQAGVDEYKAELLPEDKVGAVRELKQKYGKVAMVGDGVNDAPAMAVADVGIAMGAAGTDVAIATADLALMSDDLSRIPYALRLSQRAVSNIKQNIAVSLAIVALVVAAALAGKIGLVPGLLINEGSALLVMVNGMRLLRDNVP